MSKSLPDDVDAVKYMDHYLPRALNRYPEKLAGNDCVLQFDLTGAGGGSWAVTIAASEAKVARGAAPDARCTFTATAADWMDLVRGKLNGPMAFMTGRVQMSGDYFFAMRLGGQIMAALAGMGRS